MSEKAPFKNEKTPLSPSSEQLALPTAEQAEPLRKGEQDPAEALLEARSHVNETVQSDTQPNPLERLQQAEKASQAPSAAYINRELKNITLRRELKQVQRKLPGRQRLLSRAVHQPAVRRVSEVSAASVTRPSGLLGGGLVAFTGTSVYLYAARHTGFSYNYLVFILLFVGGFVLGLLLELLVHALLAARQR